MIRAAVCVVALSLSGAVFGQVTSMQTLTHDQRVSVGGSNEDIFGRSVAISRGSSVIGAPGKSVSSLADAGKAYIVERTSTGWGAAPTALTATISTADDDAVANALFGYAVAISEDGNTVVVSAPRATSSSVSQAGTVYVLTRSGSGWAPQAKLVSTSPTTGEFFGGSVAISGDVLVVGASGYSSSRGAIYVFRRSGSTWDGGTRKLASGGTSGDQFGWDVDIDGVDVVASAYADDGLRGAAYTFVVSSSSITQTQQLLSQTSDSVADTRFGISVAISGIRIAIGADQSPGLSTPLGNGFVQTFEVDSGGTWQFDQRLTAPSGASGDGFGTAVQLEVDALIVGAVGANTWAGSSYFFAVGADTRWVPPRKLIEGTGRTSNDAFGLGVALSDGTVLVGCQEDNTGMANGPGSAFYFQLWPASVPPPAPSECPGDITGDGMTTIQDFNILANDLGCGT